MASILNIKDPEVHALAAELASVAGKSLTQVVKEALREKLDRERDQSGRLADRAMAIGKLCASLPELDARTPDEIIGYDEHGVPR